MAGVVATTALDMSTGLNIGYWSGSTQVVANSTYIQGTSQDTMYRGKYLGSFDVDWQGQAQSGTVSGYEHYYKSAGYVSQFKLTGLNYALDDFFEARNEYSRAEFTKALLRSSDTIKGSNSSDKLYAWAGNDSISGYSGNDYLNGGTGNDKLYGGDGTDRLVGGTGLDTLTGGSNADIFDFDKASETGTTSTTRDVITDFQRGIDKIDLSSIDSNPLVAGNNSFRQQLITSSFTAPGQLKLFQGVLYGNTDSDSTPEFSIKLTGISSLLLGDIIL